MFVPNFKVLCQAVAEKCLTEKNTNIQTNSVTEKAKTIYPLYTSYTRGIITLSLMKMSLYTIDYAEAIQ